MMSVEQGDCDSGDDGSLDDAAEGNEFVHFDEYEDVVVAIELVGSQSVDVQTRPSQCHQVAAHSA